MTHTAGLKIGVAALVALALCGCISEPENTWWARKGGTDKQFRKISLACNERASDDMVKEGSGSCTYNSEGRGTYCQDVDPDDPIAVDQEKRRRERRLRYLYSKCLESAGWSQTEEGRGFKGRH